jgi:iron-sulfur cluster repair protein YtfE (RIC family)
MAQIQAPKEWLAECSDLLNDAKKKVATKLYKKYGNSILFPMFLHVDLCEAMHAVFVSAPNHEEALKFIQQALVEVKENIDRINT